jgi:hypothetical protein
MILQVVISYTAQAPLFNCFLRTLETPRNRNQDRWNVAKYDGEISMVLMRFDFKFYAIWFPV